MNVNVTDTQTDTAWRHRPRLCIASHGKKRMCTIQQRSLYAREKLCPGLHRPINNTMTRLTSGTYCSGTIKKEICTIIHGTWIRGELTSTKWSRSDGPIEHVWHRWHCDVTITCFVVGKDQIVVVVKICRRQRGSPGRRRRQVFWQRSRCRSRRTAAVVIGRGTRRRRPVTIRDDSVRSGGGVKRLESWHALTVVIGKQILQTSDVADGSSQRIDLARPLGTVTFGCAVVVPRSMISALLLLLVVVVVMTSLLLLPTVTRQSIAQRRERHVDQLDASSLAQVASFHRLGRSERRSRRLRQLTSAVKMRCRRGLQRWHEASFAAQDLTIVIIFCTIALSWLERCGALCRQGPRWPNWTVTATIGWSRRRCCCDTRRRTGL